MSLQYDSHFVVLCRKVYVALAGQDHGCNHKAVFEHNFVLALESKVKTWIKQY